MLTLADHGQINETVRQVSFALRGLHRCYSMTQCFSHYKLALFVNRDRKVFELWDKAVEIF